MKNKTNETQKLARLKVGASRFLPMSGMGIHGDSKFNRRKQKRADRKEIREYV